MISWPPELVNAIARRRAVVFVGAGASMNSENDDGQHPPSWHQFLEAGVAACAAPHREMRSYLKSGDYLTCCQLIKYRMGNHAWLNFVEQKFLEPKFKPHKIHKFMFDLDASIVATPNFDTIYDKFALAETENFLKIKEYYDEDVVRVMRGSEKQRLILKIHGSIDAPDKLIFTREDYAGVRQKYGNFYRALEALIITHTFIFIGCGMSDPDLNLLLEQYAYSFAVAPPHYFVTSKAASADYSQMLTKNYNLQMLRYSDKDNHSILFSSLEALVALVDARRNELATSLLW